MLMRHVEIAQDNWPFVNTQCGAAVAPVDDLGIPLHGNVHQEHSRAEVHDRTKEFDTAGALCYNGATIAGSQLSAEVSARPIQVNVKDNIRHSLVSDVIDPYNHCLSGPYRSASRPARALVGKARAFNLLRNSLCVRGRFGSQQRGTLVFKCNVVWLAFTDNPA